VALKSLQSRKVLLFIAVGLTAFILYLYYYVGTGNFVDVIKRANIYYYTSAFIAFIVAGFFSAVTWHTLLGTLKVKSSIRRALLLTWAGYFFDATLPEPGWSGDLSKSYILSKESDEDVGKIVASVVGQKIIGMAVTILVLILGFGILLVNYAVPQSVLVFLGGIMVVSLASFSIIYYLSISPKATQKMLNFLIRILSFILRSRFNETQYRASAEKFLNTFHKGIDMLRADKKALSRPIAFYTLSVVFDVSIVFFVFTALGYSVPVDKVLIVYALTGSLASIGVSFVGLTEIIMTTAYQALLIPLAVSFSVTLLTRVVTLWFKLVTGYVAFQWAGVGILLGKKPKSDAALESDGKKSPAEGEP
jgi:uncharacterized protein (TIRG00374 family)